MTLRKRILRKNTWKILMIGLALFLATGTRTAVAQQWTTNGNNISNTNTGNVGIGTSTPDQYARLHISGSGGFGQDIQTTTGDWVRFRFVTPTRTLGWFLDGGGAGVGQGKFGLYDYTAGQWRLGVDTSGNVGIGTMTNLFARLTTAQSGTATSIGSITGADVGLALQNTDTTAGNMQAISFQNSSGAGQGGLGVINVSSSVLAGGRFFIWTRAAGGAPTERLRVDESGNVGIGTASPSGILDAVNNQNGNTFVRIANNDPGGGGKAYFVADNGTNTFRMQQNGTGFGGYGASLAGEGVLYNTSPALTLMTDNASGIIKFATGGNSEKMRINSAGNVGIGTTSPNPNYKLDVLGNINASGTINAASGLNISGSPVTSSQWTTGSGNISYTGGNVGIGSTPGIGYKLDVTGNENVTGNLNASGTITGGNIVAKYQDVAEWVPSSEQLPAGTVVVLDSTKSNEVISSTVSYDTRVAGVVSEQPGIALGERSANKVLVATTGRVRVKVDATRAPIQVGDLLVTSDVPGVAMKSEPVNLGGVQLHRPGTLIGKALEPLAKGSGEILVLLSLQ